MSRSLWTPHMRPRGYWFPAALNPVRVAGILVQSIGKREGPARVTRDGSKSGGWVGDPRGSVLSLKGTSKTTVLVLRKQSNTADTLQLGRGQLFFELSWTMIMFVKVPSPHKWAFSPTNL